MGRHVYATVTNANVARASGRANVMRQAPDGALVERCRIKQTVDRERPPNTRSISKHLYIDNDIWIFIYI